MFPGPAAPPPTDPASQCAWCAPAASRACAQHRAWQRWAPPGAAVRVCSPPVATVLLLKRERGGGREGGTDGRTDSGTEGEREGGKKGRRVERREGKRERESDSE